jgi:thiol-disulfide isomerase/thioredoxin
MLAVSLLLLSGCAGKPPPATEAAVRSVDAAGLAQAVAAHRGEVVLVDFWATWCKPCVELFPHTVALQRRFGGRGLAVITVSLDDPDHPAAARKFLAAHATATENYLSSYDVGPAAFSAFGIDDGSLPHVQIYDRQGKPQRTFSSGGKSIDPAAIQRAVEEVVGG